MYHLRVNNASFFIQRKDKISANGRSSRLHMFYQIDVSKHFAKFTGKHLCRSLFISKVVALILSCGTPLMTAPEIN